MTWYQNVTLLQEPGDMMSLDDNKRPLWSFNVVAVKRPSSTFLEELVKVLTDASVGTLMTNIFIGPKAIIPSGDGPFLSIRATGGLGPIKNQNDGGRAYVRPTAQIVTRAGGDPATSYTRAEVMAHAAATALAAVVNRDIVP